MSGFSQAQVEQLLQPIRSNRVYHSQGQSHVAGWDITAHLNRLFGFGNWDKRVRSLELIEKDRGEALGYEGKKGWYITYRCEMTLRVRNPHGEVVCEIDDAATGSAQNQPSLADAHDLALKNAHTYALKRCAKDLGDQFGLSLYNKGSQKAVVVKTLVLPGYDDTPEPEHTVEGEGYAPGEEPFE